MTETSRGDPPPRRPEAFDPDDPRLERRPPDPAEARGEQSGGEGVSGATAAPPPSARLRHGIRWGAILLSALSLLGGLAAALWFARFVSIAIERNDWLGWTAFGLLATAGLAFAVIVLREIVGIVRLRRLGRLRQDAERALARRDLALERRTLTRILEPLRERAELKWPIERMRSHEAGVHDPGDLFRLVDREVMRALDGDARRLIASSARRVGVVSAMSPTALLTVGWVLVENIRLLRGLATLYGGRPGFLGTARLARHVFLSIVATGGVAFTDDLLGQFLGQDILRRLSRRLGESVFNSALVARVGAAAVGVIRPLPFIEATPVRARDFVAEIMRRSESEKAAKTRLPGGPGV